MAIQQDDNERDFELEDMMLRDQEAARRRQHELDMLKVQVTTPQRAQTTRRIAVAVLKAPTAFVVVIAITILVMAGKDVPEALSAFLEL